MDQMLLWQATVIQLALCFFSTVDCRQNFLNCVFHVQSKLVKSNNFVVKIKRIFKQSLIFFLVFRCAQLDVVFNLRVFSWYAYMCVCMYLCVYVTNAVGNSHVSYTYTSYSQTELKQCENKWQEEKNISKTEHTMILCFIFLTLSFQ